MNDGGFVTRLNALRWRSRSAIMARIIMAEPLRITFRYTGPEVDNGEMDVHDVLEALEGFSGAYGKVASTVNPDSQHQLRVAALDRSSFIMYLVATAIVLTQYGNTLEQIESIVNVSKLAFRIITGVIGITKHVKGQPYNFTFRDNGAVTIINSEHVELVFPPERFKIYRQKLIRDDLNKISRPLRDNRILQAELKSEDNEPEQAIITVADKEYFVPSTSMTETEREIVGVLISLNKESNSGLFEFGEGKRVRYRYVGGDDEGFYRTFGQKRGTPVRVWGRVQFDEDLNPIRIDMIKVEPLQNQMEFSTNT